MRLGFFLEPRTGAERAGSLSFFDESSEAAVECPSLFITSSSSKNRFTSSSTARPKLGEVLSGVGDVGGVVGGVRGVLKTNIIYKKMEWNAGEK